MQKFDDGAGFEGEGFVFDDTEPVCYVRDVFSVPGLVCRDFPGYVDAFDAVPACGVATVGEGDAGGEIADSCGVVREGGVGNGE